MRVFRRCFVYVFSVQRLCISLICVSPIDGNLWNLPYLSQSPDAPRKIKLFTIFDSFVVSKRFHLKDQIRVSVSSIYQFTKGGHPLFEHYHWHNCMHMDFLLQNKTSKKRRTFVLCSIPSLYQYHSRVNLCVLLTEGVRPLKFTRLTFIFYSQRKHWRKAVNFFLPSEMMNMAKVNYFLSCLFNLNKISISRNRNKI